ncbi:MAG: DUF5686 and carboxypeptidase regulatory-like domain-containing protein [Odoribacter sp.]|nr:DUF5686 and carboxypeptidase regulatory-like domain-containing protein [Odoribacter sp.]
MKKVALLIFCAVIWNFAFAQSTRVRGKISDASTGELLPLVNVVFKGTNIGTTSDFDGMFTLETREEVEELQISFIGYEMQTLKINKATFNQLEIELVPQYFELEEFVVKPGPNPAHAILQNVIKNKKRNNPERIQSYFCNTYTKMELDITNINPQFKNKKLQKNFGFIFEHMDTSIVTGQSFLPIMISEASADYYYRKSPSLSREIVKASRISGIEEDYTLAQFTGHLHGNVNFYDNYIDLFDIRFASPLSDHGLLYYKYYLIDSVNIEGRKTYKIRFHPKAFSTPVLDGEVNIDSLSWALVSANVKMVKGLNVNWIRHLNIETENQLLQDSVWFPKRDKLFADFSLVMSDSAKLASFLGHREVDYSNVRLDPVIPPEVLKMDHNVIISKDVLKNDEDYWTMVRPYELSDKEKQIYSMVDSIKNVPLYQNIYTIITTAIDGYYDTKYVGFGPYYKLLSFNKLEGVRFQLGARTTEDFSKKIRLFGHAAYGTKDEELKGGLGFDLAFNDLPTSKLTVSYKHDVLQLGASVNAFTEGNILSSIFSRGNNDRLSMVDQIDIKYEKEWRQGFTNVFAGQHRDIKSSKYVPFITHQGEEIESIQSTSFQLNTRISKDEMVIRKAFDKYSLGSSYPIVNLELGAGVKGLYKNDYEYYRVQASILYDFNIPPFGQSKMILSGGKIFGKVPYPLLKLHEGNATYFYDPYAYSCMNYYEFASDLWAGFVWEHHFKGFFLGKIPLMNKLKWREVFVFKGLIGSLTEKNNGGLKNTEAILLFPEGLSSVSKPYFETGVGIENIFRLFRVDAVWRLTHRKKHADENITNFTINFGMNINF